MSIDQVQAIGSQNHCSGPSCPRLMMRRTVQLTASQGHGLVGSPPYVLTLESSGTDVFDQMFCIVNLFLSFPELRLRYPHLFVLGHHVLPVSLRTCASVQ